MSPTRILPLLLLLAGIALALSPAGTTIRNQAVVSYGGDNYLSNEVETVVRAVCQADLGPDGSVATPGQFVSAGPSQRAYLPYALSNAGNVDTTFDLGWALDAASAWTPSDVGIYRDLDANGRRDPGEPRITSLALPRGDSARLVLEVVLPAGALGDAWLSPLASCPGGPTDQDNYARVRAVTGPALQLAKAVSRTRLAPGDSVAFELRLQNVGSAGTGAPVVLTDMLDTAALDGLAYLVGSAVASQGALEFFDGASWSAAPSDPVLGLRVTVDDLAPGELLVLTFGVSAEATAAAGPRRNVAEAEGPGGPARVAADVEVAGDPVVALSHHLGPRGNPRALPGGEGSADDRQEEPFLVFGQRFCFPHTLENSGTQADRYRLEIAGLPAGVTATFDLREGVPLANPLELRPGGRRDFLVCLVSSSVTGAFSATVEAVSLTTGARNRTVDAVGRVEPGDALRLHKEADAEGVLIAGQELSYTLTVENANPFDLTDVVISDPLLPLVRQGPLETPAGTATSFVSATDGGTFDPVGRVVRWRVSRLASGDTLRRTVRIRLPDALPATAVFTLTNRFTLQAQELPAPVPSNEVAHTFPEVGLQIDKRVTPEQARVGSTLDYVLEVRNPTELTLALRLLDAPPPRTSYLPGSAELTLGSVTRRVEPERGEHGLEWDLSDLPDLELGPSGGPRDLLVVRYRLVLQPGAEGELRNTAQAFGTYATDGESVGAVASDVAAAVVTVERDAFSDPDAVLLGRVFLDRDDDGRYSREVDTPLPGARVLLANGVQALSDAEGRYAFRGVRPGTRSVMLDPTSAPFTPRPHPEALGEGYRHRVVAQGVTVSDFPLEPPAGLAAASRSTVLVLGPLRLEKRHLPLPSGVRVVLTLESSEPLPELRVTDPGPGGAPPRVFTFERFEGTTTLTYDLDDAPPLTDPEVGWRYP